jgi:membrane protease YdiL (CAAX protease family)
VVIQALIFAVWHLGAGARLMDGDILLGVAANIVAIGPFGLAYGYIFHRTRNLMACSLIHAGLNSMF